MTWVLVTGANGFVGSRLCSSLSSKGCEVRGAVREQGSALTDVTETIAVGEIGADTDWSCALKGVDCVMHLAARAHIMHDLASDPEAAFHSVNVAGSTRLVEQAAAAGARRLVYVSSIKVNGEQTIERPFSVSDPPAPEDAYGRSKLAAEQALFEVAQRTGMELAVVRPCSVLERL